MSNWDLVAESVRRHSDHPQGLEEVFQEALKLGQDLPTDRVFLEVGVRDGGSARAWLHAIYCSNRLDRWLWTVDPYGDRLYMGAAMDYGEERYRGMQIYLSAAADATRTNWCHWRMTSQEFITVAGLLWFNYKGNQWLMDRVPFGFVFLDGDHTPEVVKQEVEWFGQRMVDDEALIVIDDERFYPKVGEFWGQFELKDGRLWVRRKDLTLWE